MSKLVIFIISEMIRITANKVPIYSSYLSLRLFVIKIFFLFEKKLYFDYIQPILNTFIRYNYKAQRQGNIRSERVRGGFFNFLEIKVDLKFLRGWKWTTRMFFPTPIKDWSGLHYECYSTFRADTTKTHSRQPWLAFSRLHSLWKCSKFMTGNFPLNERRPDGLDRK